MNIVIRKAIEEDCSRLLELVRELAAFEKAPAEVTVSADHFADSGFGNRPVWWGFVAETDGVICGFALYYIRFSTWKGRRLYLEDIYITREMRGKGIGTLLFERLIEEAKRLNMSGVVWQVLEWNEPAISFYRKYNAKFDAEWVNCSIEL